MSDQVNVTAQVKFLNNLELMLQNQLSQVFSLGVVLDVGGAEKAKIKDYFGSVGTRTGDDRHGDTQYTSTPHDALWITKPSEEYTADLVDRGDQQATSIAIGSGYMMAQTAAINRHWDDTAIANGLYGSIITGKEGTTISPLPGGNIIPVTEGGASGAQGMNVEKLDAADQWLLEQYNDPHEERFMILCAKQNRELAREVKVTSSDFAALGGRVDPRNGLIIGYKGWNFINLELGNPLLKKTAPLSLDGNGHRRLPFWKKSGLATGTWERLFARVSELPGKRYSTQYYAGTTVNATRTQPGKSGIVLCS